MQFQAIKKDNWLIIRLEDRVDSFNERAFFAELEAATQDEKSRVALDFVGTRFLSFASIKFIAKCAKEFNSKGGIFALIQPSEKIKRQIDIYASLKDFHVYRRSEDFERQFESPLSDSIQL